MVLEGGGVFVRTYLSVIYHTTTPPPTFFHGMTCELDTKQGSDEMDTIAGEFTSGDIGNGNSALGSFYSKSRNE